MAFPLSGVLGVGSMMLDTANKYMNQAQQQDNFDEQMRFQKYMYEDSKRYNSMQAQVQRMRVAGINPALAIGSGQLGAVSTPSGQPSAPTPVSLGVGENLQGLASLQSSEAESMVAKEDAMRLNQDNQTRMVKNSLDIATAIEKLRKLGIDTSNAYELLKQNMFTTEHQQEDFDRRMNKLTAESNFLDSQSYNNQILSAKLGFEVEHQEEEFNKRMNLLDQQAFNAYYTAIAAGKSADAAAKTAESVYYDAHKILGIPEGKIDNDRWNNIVVGKIDALAAQSYVPESEGVTNGSNFNVGSRHIFTLSGGYNHGKTSTKQRHVTGTTPGRKRY